MKKVITYGTFDLLHYGHKRLLERAKELGDYLVVGITSDDFDRARGKINAQQSLAERIENVRGLGIADEILVEEYEGQKIDDIRRLGIDIFAIGSDWEGKFDYLREYCEVVYFPRTEGVSSTALRERSRALRLGIVGDGNIAAKHFTESAHVDGVSVSAVLSRHADLLDSAQKSDVPVVSDFDTLLEFCDAVYLANHPSFHVSSIENALKRGKHVLCESPIALSAEDCQRLFGLAEGKNVVLMDAVKTAYSTAYNRLLVLVKSGKIGDVVSVSATCTSLMPPYSSAKELEERWNSRTAWAPTALLPIFQILGTVWKQRSETAFCAPEATDFDLFSKLDFIYPSAVGTAIVAKGVKSEGELVVSGTKGYIVVPAPWWKTDYFEARFENQEENRRYFYPLDGEGIRAEILAFARKIATRRTLEMIPREISVAIASQMFVAEPRN